jgi:hypothetical protein
MSLPGFAKVLTRFIFSNFELIANDFMKFIDNNSWTILLIIIAGLFQII